MRSWPVLRFQLLCLLLSAGGKAIALQTAIGLVGDGRLYESCFQCRAQIIGSECRSMLYAYGLLNCRRGKLSMNQRFQ